MRTKFNEVDLVRDNLIYKYSFNANLKLGNGYKAESRAFFRSPRQTIQGERPSFSMLSFGIKKDFKNKRGSIGIGMIEPFSKYKDFNTDIVGEMETVILTEEITKYYSGHSMYRLNTNLAELITIQ